MPRILTDKENVAATVLSMIMQTTTSLKRERVQLLEIGKRVEYQDRKMVLEWIDSAISCGIATMYGEEIAISAKGHVFLAFTALVANAADHVDEMEKTHPVLVPVLAAIAAESRFRPPSSTVDSPTPRATTSSGTCFVASVAYNNPNHPDVMFLRGYRDTVLSKSKNGRAFISWYWKNGPKLAKIVAESTVLRKSAKLAISTIVKLLK